MCGFFGEMVWGDTRLTDKDQFAGLLALSQKRGPDNTNTWSDDSVQFGFNRLAIQDLSEFGSQPMADDRKENVIVFNGEIYNHLELRNELLSTGHQFKGHSDTETILTGIAQWGFTELVKRLDGMFAIVCYHRPSKTLYLARDFAGIKPLFLGKTRNGLVFGSQYDQLCSHPDIRDRSFDPAVLRLYLEQHFMPAPFGLLTGTFQLLPGEIMVVRKGEMTKERYWEFPSSAEAEVFSEKDALEILDESLRSAVKSELISDVPLGAFLSGGVDSPLVTYFASKLSPGLSTFSIGSDSTKHDESEQALRFAKELNVESNVYSMNAGSAAEWWAESMKSLHEPLADYSILPTYVVSSFARKKVTVALSGDGGDELFFGYDRFGAVGKNVSMMERPRTVRKAMYYYSRLRNSDKYNSGLLNTTQSEGHQYLHSRIDQRLLNAIEKQHSDFKLPENYDLYKYPVTSDERELMGMMRKAEFYGMMQKTLRKVDLASMENSLEVRVPFLKRSLIETSLKLDYSLSYSSHGNGKKLLRKLLAQKLPESTRDMSKKGFTIPLAKWLRQDLKNSVGDVLFSSSVEDIIPQRSISELWDEHQKGERSHSWSLFTVYALEKWRENLKK